MGCRLEICPQNNLIICRFQCYIYRVSVMKLEDTRLKLISSVKILDCRFWGSYLVLHVDNVFKFGLVCETDEAEDHLSGNGHNDVDGNNM